MNIQSNETKTQETLAESLARIMLPRKEEEVYRSWMRENPLWSIDEFAALIGGLTPENYKNGTKGSTQITDDLFAKRSADATKIFTQFLDYMESHSITNRDFILTDQNMFWSPWKFIKWVAQNDIPMHKRFFEALPLSLMELYTEFQPINIALRTAHHHSKTYHKALYLHHAQKLLKTSPHLTPITIYRHPLMENVERYIRELGGKYKKRTILESWLPEVVTSSRGRPKKRVP